MSANQPNRPNILLIETDQWNGRCLSALGHPEVATPNLDRLAEEARMRAAAEFYFGEFRR